MKQKKPLFSKRGLGRFVSTLHFPISKIQPMFVEKSLTENEEIVFNAGLHTKSIKMRFADFAKIAGEKLEEFAR